MRLHIPKTGDAARLASDWEFPLHADRRNVEFHNAFQGHPGIGVDWSSWNERRYLLPAGTELVFDRIYIRQDKDEFASVTFIVKDHPTRDDLVGERFWVKLDDANRLELDWTDSDNPVGGFPKTKYQALMRERRAPAEQEKRFAANAAKVELAAARAYVRELCDQSSHLNRSSFEVQQHVDGIIRDVLQAHWPSQAAGARQSHLRPSDVRFRMTCHIQRKGDPERWHSRSTNNPDGTVTRDLRFTYDGKKFGGFRLTMRGSDVISCAVLG